MKSLVDSGFLRSVFSWILVAFFMAISKKSLLKLYDKERFCKVVITSNHQKG